MVLILLTSLSARRAWIEIDVCLYRLPLILVALRKESVDRNIGLTYDGLIASASLSARRAWIEICCPCRAFWLLAVALRKESVDRNFEGVSFLRKITVALRKESVDRNRSSIKCAISRISRSPQGERG